MKQANVEKTGILLKACNNVSPDVVPRSVVTFTSCQMQKWLVATTRIPSLLHSFLLLNLPLLLAGHIVSREKYQCPRLLCL